MSTSEAITRGVRVSVRAEFLPRHSQPALGHWVFAYTVRIRNEGTAPVKLMTRHWLITDAAGQVREVQGDGVVGVQPHLLPGQAFEYTSGCPLTTPSGTMHGTYQMVTDDGDHFDAEVAPFELGEPYSWN